MDRFAAMQAFARVVETRSFTQAAHSLHLGRASVSQLVQALEAHLRVKLLHRTTRSVQLTPEGAAYYERVQPLLAALEDAETSLSPFNTQPRGRLRVDVPSPLACQLLLPALGEFQARYPDIQLHLGVSDRPVHLLDDNVDCVIRGGKPSDLSLVARPLGALPMGLYAAPSYLAQHGPVSTPQALHTAPHQTIGFLSAHTGRVLPLRLQRGAEQLQLQSRSSLVLDDGNACLAAGLAGLGVLPLPCYLAAPHVASGALQPILTDWQLPPLPLHLAYAPNRHLGLKLRVWMDWVSALLQRHTIDPERPPR